MSEPLTEPSPADPRATTVEQPAVGATVLQPISAGRYLLGEEIARGGMGVIYRAIDTALGREVAVKVLQEKYAPDSGTARRFADEARITAQLQHPGIPPVHDLGTLPDGRPFLAMKLIKGQTLEELLSARADLSAERGRFEDVFEAVCQALAYAHAHDVIHRDLKPANVMVGAFGEVQVMDWGLAKVLVAGLADTTDPEATRAESAVVSLREPDGEGTQAGIVLGTPAFMPPEQAVGAVGKVDRRSDVFGLGAILAVILTGKPPFAAETAETMRVWAAQGKLDECFARLDQCDAEAEWVRLCKRCLAPDKEDRPNDAAEVAESLAALRAAADERARQAELERVRVVEQRKRRRVQLTLALSVIGLVAAAAFGVVLAFFWKQAERAKEMAEFARIAAEAAKANEEQARQSAEKAQRDAENARDAEKLARKDAEKAQRTAEDAHDAEKIAREKFERSEYGRTIQLAYEEWRGNNILATINLLGGPRPELRGWEWHCVNHLCHSDLLTLPLEAIDHVSVSFSRDGTRIFTVGLQGPLWDRDLVAKVWDAKTGSAILTRTLKAGWGDVNSASISLDGTRIATAGRREAEVWDIKTGTRIAICGRHFGPVYSVSFSPDGTRLVTASEDETAKVWDIKTGNEIVTLGRSIVRKGHSDQVLSASFSADSTRIVTTSADKTAMVWDAGTGGNIVTLKGHTDSVYSASFSPDGSRIATSSRDGTVKIWDAKTGADLKELAGVRFATFSPDGLRLITAKYPRTATIIDANTGTEIRTLRGHLQDVTYAEFSPDGSRIVTTSTDGAAKVWDANIGSDTPTFKVHVDGVKKVSCNSDGTRILTLSTAGTAELWDGDISKEAPTLKGRWPGVRSASITADGSRVVTASTNGTAKAWDATTGALLFTLKEGVQSVLFSRDGTRILTSDSRGVVKGWDARTGNYIGALAGLSSDSASFSPDGTRVITAGLPYAIVWDVGTAKEVFKLHAHTNTVISAAFSPDGKRIVTTSADATVKIWDAETGRETLTLKGHYGAVNWAAFTADSTRIITASDDGTVKMWDARPSHPDR